MTLIKKNFKSVLIVNAEIIMQVLTCLAILIEILLINIMGMQIAYAISPSTINNYLCLNKEILIYLCVNNNATSIIFGLIVADGALLFALIKTQKKINEKY